MNDEDICVWADGTWCYGEELEEMTHMSDDFRVIKYSDFPDSEYWKFHIDNS